MLVFFRNLRLPFHTLLLSTIPRRQLVQVCRNAWRARALLIVERAQKPQALDPRRPRHAALSWRLLRLPAPAL